MTSSMLYYADYYPGLPSQKLFCEGYAKTHSGSLPIADEYANPITIRLIAIKRVLEELDKMLHPVYHTFFSNQPSNPSDPYKYYTSSINVSGSSTINTQVDLLGSNPISIQSDQQKWVVNKLSGNISIKCTEETFLFDYHVKLYNFLLSTETALDRIVKEILVCYSAGTFTDTVYFSSFFKPCNNSFRNAIMSRYPTSTILADLARNKTDHILYCTWLRNVYAHQGYVRIEIDSTSNALILPSRPGMYSAVTSFKIFDVCSIIFKDLLTLLDSVYTTMYKDLCR